MDEWVILLREIDAKVADLQLRLSQSDSEIKQDLEVIKRDVQRLHELQPSFVTRAEFTPVRQVVYGMIALILTCVMGALLALVVKQ